MGDPLHLAGMLAFGLVGLTMGMLGGGGSVLAVPILVFLLGLDPHQAVSTSLVIVALTSAIAVVPHARAGRVQWRTGLVFGAAGMVGSFGAGLVSRWIPGEVLLVGLALMMGVIAIAMLRGKAQTADCPEPAPSPKVTSLLMRGLVVGAATGLVGAGGGFVVVPAFVLMCGMPMAEAVGTSLFVIAMQSTAGFVGHASHVEIPWGLVAQVAGLAVGGSFVGALFASRVPQSALRKAFGVLVLGMAAALIVQRIASMRGPSHDANAPGSHAARAHEGA
ncbi:MAG: sulfite exporter TauE/SafE family protein [Deltaproteobacteria bacterium]|nr:sulfite exporter TauE/SafE family protein [Deltaproteobacteria bacterium]